MALATSRKDFNAILPCLLDDIASYVSATGASSAIVESITHVSSSTRVHIQTLPLTATTQAMELNAPKGHLPRGLMVPETGLILLNRPLSPKEFRDLSILGWLVEFLSGSLLILDDIMDGSTIRRGQPCWYLQPNVGMLAINDACLLRSAISLLVRKHFHEHPAYLAILEIFQEIGFLTELGQEADGLACQQVDPRKWDMEQYEFIITNKTSYYSFYLSKLLALHYLGLATPRNMRQARDILVVLGKHYQMQNDFEDVYGEPSVTGKVGTDIQENKCTWLIVQALEICDGRQRRTLLESYGKNDGKLAMGVKGVFEELNLRGLYENYEKQMACEIEDMIEAVDETEGLRKELFRRLLKCCHVGAK